MFGTSTKPDENKKHSSTTSYMIVGSGTSIQMLKLVLPPIKRLRILLAENCAL